MTSDPTAPGSPSTLYVGLAQFAQTLRRISHRPAQDLPELFRRMVFNLVIGNSDDCLQVRRKR